MIDKELLKQLESVANGGAPAPMSVPAEQQTKLETHNKRYIQSLLSAGKKIGGHRCEDGESPWPSTQSDNETEVI